MLSLKTKPKETDAANRKGFLEDIGGAIGEMMDGIRSMIDRIPEARQKLQNLPETNYQLALRHQEEGNLNDAIIRYKLVLKFDPTNVMARYNLGSCMLQLGNPSEAVHCFQRVLELQPGMPEAAYMLAMLTSSPAPAQAPLSIMHHHFNRLAKVYEQNYVQVMEYQGHQLVYGAVSRFIKEERGAFELLDLGCGTGLVGKLLRAKFGFIKGVDIAEAMLEIAREKHSGEHKSYDSLVLADAKTFLSQPGRVFDVITAAGVFNYIGDLSELFRLAAGALKPGGILVCTAEKYNGHAFELMPGIGRYRHGESYLFDVAKETHLATVSIEEIMLYKDFPGWLCVFQKQE